MRYDLTTPADDPYSDRTCFPVQSSVLGEKALLHRVVSDYDIPKATACRFLIRGDADIYRVTTGGPRFYLKVYRPPRTWTQAEAEARFVTGLAQQGLPVVCPVPRTNGSFAFEVVASEGMRPILLFEEAPPPLCGALDESLCRQLGSAVGQLHETADSLAMEGLPLPTLDCRTVMDDMMPFIKGFLSDAEYAYLVDLSTRIRPELEALPVEPPDFGLCHADLVFSNVRSGPDERVTLFDFGNVGYTWRSYDLGTLYWSLEHRTKRDERHGLWETLLRGYSKVRALPAGLSGRLPLLLILRQIKFLSGNCATLPLRLGTDPFEGDFLTKGIAYVRQVAEEIENRSF